MSLNSEENLRIAFLHPDLGIGGAEQLVINLAVALKKKGHYVKIYTPYHDRTHCFEETINGTLDVEVRGSLFPRHIFGKLIAFCAYVRMILAALWLVLFGGHYDCVIVDQVSVCVPFLRIFRRRVLFYCHFPDKLLCVEKKSIIKKIYRFFLDFFEEVTLIPANLILVNSNFTKGFFYDSFPILKKLKVKTDVLYPCIDLNKFKKTAELLNVKPSEFTMKDPFFLSLNRYERKKNIGLAIKAFGELRKNCESAKNVKLVIAGGYDPRIPENLEHKQELESLASSLELAQHVIFRTSIPEEERAYLLKNALAILYTPENEHFGIVPLEAQYMNTPVLACNSGGPKESVVHGKTGYLIGRRDEEGERKLGEKKEREEEEEKKEECLREEKVGIKTEEEWGRRMKWMLEEEEGRRNMGKEGKKNVEEKFSFEMFENMLEGFVKEVARGGKKTV